MARKTFKAAVRTTTLDFETSNGLTFNARPKLSAGVVLNFTAAVTPDDGEDVSVGRIATALRVFFSKAISPSDVDRFMEMIDDPDGIELDELTDIAAWLAGEYTARPTGKDSRGTSPTSPTGDDSTPGALPAGTTYSRKEPTPQESSV